MAKLPQGLDLTATQNRWASVIEPVISNPANNSLLLKNVVLASGTNVINHRLGRKLQGWVIVRKRGPAAIYDNQDGNQIPELTLVLVSDAAVTVDLEVF